MKNCEHFICNEFKITNSTILDWSYHLINCDIKNENNIKQCVGDDYILSVDLTYDNEIILDLSNLTNGLYLLRTLEKNTQPIKIIKE